MGCKTAFVKRKVGALISRTNFQIVAEHTRPQGDRTILSYHAVTKGQADEPGELKIPFEKYSGSGGRPHSKLLVSVRGSVLKFFQTQIYHFVMPLFQTWFLVSIPVSYFRPKRLKNHTVCRPRPLPSLPG